MYSECSNSLRKCKNKKKQILKQKNRITQFSLFKYTKLRNFETSAVLYLVIPNVGPHLFFKFSKLEVFEIIQIVR